MAWVVGLPSFVDVNRTDRNITYNQNMCDSSKIREHILRNKQVTNQNRIISNSKSPIFEDIKFPFEKRIFYLSKNIIH